MEKISIVIISILFICITLGAIYWFFCLSPTITEYKDTIARLTNQDKLLRSEINRITELNREAESRINKLIADNNRAERIIGEVAKGLSGTSKDLSGIINLLSAIIGEISNTEEVQ